MRSVTRNILGYATVLALVSLPALSAAPRTTVRVMTANMDAGTDLGFALAYLNTSTPTVGIDLTYQEILQSNFVGRAAILAQQIAASQPDLVSLQEVTVWSKGPSPFNLVPEIDQEQLLLGALAALGQDYSVVQVNNLTSVAVPMSNGEWLGFLDRNVVLARNNAGFTVSHPSQGIFNAKLTIPLPLPLPPPFNAVDVVQGWIAADITFGTNTFTFVDTHLAGQLSGAPDLTGLQVLQAQQLATLFSGANPLVIAGDFNSNATHTPPEQTPSVSIMKESGLTDTWPAANHGEPGFTWPLYVEDPLAAHPRGPFERIDFIFERGLGIEFVQRVGWTGAHASDHASVVAALSF